MPQSPESVSDIYKTIGSGTLQLFGRKVRDVKQECHRPIFDGWSNVPSSFMTRSGWALSFRSVPAKTDPAARVKIVRNHHLVSLGIDVQRERLVNLYHHSQTKEMRATPLRTARLQFYKYFAEPSDWQRIIRWTKGDYIETTEGWGWDSEIEKYGWRVFREKLTFDKLVAHETGRDIYGIFGGRNSTFLLIDLDLHNQPIGLFTYRLRLLLDRFHGKHRCHFQVADSNARGVHVILFFGKAGCLTTRRRWLLRALTEIDNLDPSGQLTKPVASGRAFNIEVYPDPSKPVRLPLARERIMLLDRPLRTIIRRGKAVQDVIGYMDWLMQDEQAIRHMPKEDVENYILERLDHSCAKPALELPRSETGRPGRKGVGKGTAATDSRDIIQATRRSLKGKTREAIIKYWAHGDGTQFPHLNSAILTTLQAVHAEGVDEAKGVEILMNLIEDLPDKGLSSRLTGEPKLVRLEVDRQARKIWSSQCNEKWRKSVECWSKCGFKASDRTTWSPKPSLEVKPVVVDCEEITFTSAERQQTIERVAPLLVGKKQANKTEKQDEVIRAVAYLLRYIKCCPREIPYKAIPSILSLFNIKLGKDSKSSRLLRLLTDMEWIYVRSDYYCPKLHGEKTDRGRARAYGIGPKMAYKFGLSYSQATTTTKMDLLSVIPFFDAGQF